MRFFVGGVASVLLGILGITIWYHVFSRFIVGVIPFIVLYGGLITAYLGYRDEAKDKLPRKPKRGN
jgi:hypothetical protein